MTRARIDWFCAAALVLGLAALVLKFADGTQPAGPFEIPVIAAALVGILGLSAWFVRRRAGGQWRTLILLAVVALGVVAALRGLYAHGLAGQAAAGYWAFILAIWALAWRGIDGLAEMQPLNPNAARALGILVPALFGAWLLFLWEVLVAGFAIPQVLLPAPSTIGVRFAGSLGILWEDFNQTFLKAVLAGYAMGCGSGFLVAILADRVGFLKRGLLPLGNLVSALPIVGVAPIMVMWFGFDWQSKAAVVVVMTFFPMLINAGAGLAAAGTQERELMQSYGAGYWQTLFKLRLPASLPFVFNALKINSTLALIGAIVAEFFGTPIVGMGFRISTEVGRMNVDMVWAEILVAALAGSLFYGLLALIERNLTFWHPSYRRSR